MKKPRQKITDLFCCLALLLLLPLCFYTAYGQYSRAGRVRVYNPKTYNRTRAAMSRRTVARKKVKKPQHVMGKARRQVQ
jgi:hypothetical protein